MSETNEPAAMTIGAVAHATGIPPNTLRTWERRYGFPEPIRSEGGHRLYHRADVERIRWISQALQIGFRPGQAVAMDMEELKRAVGAAAPAIPPQTSDPEPYVIAWLDAASRLDGQALTHAFELELARLGVLRFVTRRAGPFVERLGQAQASGELEIFHEHFVSGRLSHFLDDVWQPLADRNPGPVAVVATLPDEDHTLGLRMAATALAVSGWRVCFLGAQTPLPQIEAAARHTGARAVVLSVSRFADTDATEESLGALSQTLGSEVALVVGGAGAPSGIDSVVRPDGFAALAEWARAAAV